RDSTCVQPRLRVTLVRRVLGIKELRMAIDPSGFRRRPRCRLGIAAACLVFVTASVQAADEAGDRARVERAVSYLVARQEAWSNFARSFRGEGPDRTNCVSCHTVLSYALVRPELGRFTEQPEQEAPPAAAETRTLGAIQLRVAHWADLDTPRF